MKTLHSLAEEAYAKRLLWGDIAEDPQALKDRGIHKEVAVRMNYFYRGRYEALMDAVELEEVK